MATTLTWMLAGLAALLVAGGAVAGGLLGDDDGEDLLSADLAQGGRHSVEALAAEPPSVVEADYELDNRGSGTAIVTLALAGPDGRVLETARRSVAPGQHVEVEVEHAFATVGAAGAYKATLTVEQGSVHLTEGGVDIDEREDGEDEDDE